MTDPANGDTEDDMTDDELIEEVAEIALRSYLRVLDAGGGEPSETECISYAAKHFGVEDRLGEGSLYERVAERFYDLIPTDDDDESNGLEDEDDEDGTADA